MATTERDSSKSPARRSTIGAKIGRVLGDVDEDSENRSIAETDASSVSTKVEDMGERRQGVCLVVFGVLAVAIFCAPAPEIRR